MSTAAPSNLKEYLGLVKAFPLRPITSDRKLDKAITIIDELLDKPKLSKQAQDYLSVLSDLVKAYEDVHYPIRDIGEDEALADLMREHGLTARELAKETGIVNSTISNVLNGKRKLTREHIETLSDYFKVSPLLFLG